MIRINLLKSLQPGTSAPQTRASRQALAPEIEGLGDFPDLVQKSRNKSPWVFVLLLLLIAAGIGFFIVYEHSITEKETLQGDTPAASATTTPPVPAVPVSEPVKSAATSMVDSNLESMAEGDFPGYSQWKPSRQIAFQHLSGTRLLRDLRSAAPPGVGFTRITFTPPGGFYIHGVASTEADLQHFQNALTSLPGTRLSQNQIQPVGEGGTSREFHFSGKIHYDTVSLAKPVNRVLAPNKVKTALQGFMSDALSFGIKLEPIQARDSSVVEGVKRFLYHTEARCDYSRLQTLLEKLQRTGSSLGFQRVNLEARGDDAMVADLDLLVYVK